MTTLNRISRKKPATVEHVLVKVVANTVYVNPNGKFYWFSSISRATEVAKFLKARGEDYIQCGRGISLVGAFCLA